MMSTGTREGSNSTSGPPAVKTILIGTATMSLTAASLGAIVGLVWCIATGWHEPIAIGAVGFVFGGWIGLVVGLLFASIRRLRELRSRSGLGMVQLFIFFAAIAGAILAFPFSEGLAMALYLAMEGAIAGGVIGALLALVFVVLGRIHRPQP